MMLYGFTVYIKSNDIHKEITGGVERWFYTSNYVLERSLLKAK